MMGSEKFLRWKPLEGLPERPFLSIEIIYGETLRLRAKYWIEEETVLMLNFPCVKAFSAYEEFSDILLDEGQLGKLPKVAGDSWNWPLVEVQNSSWVGSVLRRNRVLEHYPWRHLTVISGDMVVHVMANDEPIQAELIAKP